MIKKIFRCIIGCVILPGSLLFSNGCSTAGRHAQQATDIVVISTQSLKQMANPSPTMGWEGIVIGLGVDGAIIIYEFCTDETQTKED